MSDTPKITDDQKLTRAFPVELAEGDGRTVELKIVPYNTPTRVADPPDYVPYQEEWLPRAFEKQANAADRVKVWLNFEHNKGLSGIVGHGVALQERDDHLHGVFRVHENADGDKALQLVREGLLTGASLEAIALSSRRTSSGVVQRLRAHLDGVALCRFPAYKEAGVLAVREDQITVEHPPVAPVENPQLVARLEALGIQPLQRLAVTSKPWNGAASRFTDAEYQASCVLDRGGNEPPKVRCSLPVLEPDGTLNTNALAAAAARLPQVAGATQAAKAAAARKLVRYYRIAGMDAPNTVMSTARA